MFNHRSFTLLAAIAASTAHAQTDTATTEDDGSSYLTADEVVTMTDEVFSAADVDVDQQVSFTEFSTYIKDTYGSEEEITNDETHEAFISADANEDNTLEYGELLQWMTAQETD